MVPLIRIPLIFKTSSAEIQEETKFMVTNMQVVDNLCFELTIYLRYGFQFNANLIINQEVIEKVMFQFHTMKHNIYMLFSLIFNARFFKQHLESILKDFFLESTAHLPMQLHRNSK